MASDDILKREQAVSIINSDLYRLQEEYGVKDISLFGSVARDEAEADSDVDILVEFIQSPGMFEFIGLKQHLEELFHREVDLTTPEALHSKIRKKVLETEINASQEQKLSQRVASKD